MNNAVFILTYSRANNLYTYKTLLESEYNGKIYLVISDDDPQMNEYFKLYGKQVIVFSKEEARGITDLADNFEKRNIVVFARNKVFEIAKELGLDCFCVLDDDYKRFSYRRCFGNKLKGFKVQNLQNIFDFCYDFLMKTDIIDCFAFAQEGDFIGGANSFEAIGFKRKIMNCYFFKTNRPIRFIGSINEDLTASVYEGQRGKYLFTINDVSVAQLITQSNKGGLTEAYLDSGTYIKSFYSVIACPNSVKISAMGSKDLRIHHKVEWNKAVPKLIREVCKNG